MKQGFWMWITFGRFCGCLAVDNVDKGGNEHNFCEKCCVFGGGSDGQKIECRKPGTNFYLIPGSHSD